MTGVIDNNPANTREHWDFERLANMHFKMFVIETYKSYICIDGIKHIYTSTSARLQLDLSSTSIQKDTKTYFTAASIPPNLFSKGRR